MKLKSILISIAFAAASIAPLAAAQSVILSHGEAAQLYLALNTIQAGLSPQNTGYGADDINALEPAVKALDAARAKAQKRVVEAAKADQGAVSARENDSLQLFVESPVTVLLEPIVLTDQEMTDAKVTIALLAPIKRFLSPPAKK